MIISLCGFEFDKQIVINEFKKIYGNKIVIYNYYREFVNTVKRGK